MNWYKTSKKALQVDQLAYKASADITEKAFDIVSQLQPTGQYQEYDLGTYVIPNPYLDKDLHLRFIGFVNGIRKEHKAFVDAGTLEMGDNSYSMVGFINLEFCKETSEAFEKQKEVIEQKRSKEPERYENLSPEFFTTQYIKEVIVHEITHALDPKIIKGIFKNKLSQTYEGRLVSSHEIDAILQNCLSVTRDIVKRGKGKAYAKDLIKELKEGINSLNDIVPESEEDFNSISDNLPSLLKNYHRVIQILYVLNKRESKNDIRKIIKVLYNEWNEILKELESAPEEVT